MRTMPRCVLGAMCLCLVSFLTACAQAPVCSPAVRTETVTVYQDRYPNIDPDLISDERIDWTPGTGVVEPTKALDDHDVAATQALARANGKFAALRCVGLAGVDGTTAASCFVPTYGETP